MQDKYLLFCIRALYSVAKESSEVEKVTSDMKAISEVMLDVHKGLGKDFYYYYSYTAEQLDDVAGIFLNNMDLSSTTKRLIMFLAKYRKFVLLHKIAANWEEYALQASGIRIVEVYSAIDLNTSQEAKIRDKIKNICGEKDFIMRKHVDPAIIGGLVINIDNYTFDDSVQSKLKNILNATEGNE